MKVTNCLKLVLLCGCPPENSTFQLRIDEKDNESGDSKMSALKDHPEAYLSRPDMRRTASDESINICEAVAQRIFHRSSISDMPLNSDPELSFKDEQKAITIILEYLRMNNAEMPFQDLEVVQENRGQKSAKAKKREKQFKKSKSITGNCGNTISSSLTKKFSNKAKSCQSFLRKFNNTSEEKVSNAFRRVENQRNEVVLEKESVRMPNVKMPLSIFSELTNLDGITCKTIAETSEMEIKEVVATGNSEQLKKLKKGLLGCEEIQHHCKEKIHQVHRSTNKTNKLNCGEKCLSPDTCLVLNPNIIDEISPYILRFVKNYVGDFRRYLLDSFIGVESISLDYFESMIDVIETFPIDDLTFFKNLKYALALLFPHENNAGDTEKDIKYEIKPQYQEKLDRKPTLEFGYKYTIKPSNNPTKHHQSKSEEDLLPSFLVRYYPASNKLLMNRGSQTEKICKSCSYPTTFHSYEFLKSKS